MSVVPVSGVAKAWKEEPPRDQMRGTLGVGNERARMWAVRSVLTLAAGLGGKGPATNGVDAGGVAREVPPVATASAALAVLGEVGVEDFQEVVPAGGCHLSLWSSMQQPCGLVFCRKRSRDQRTGGGNWPWSVWGRRTWCTSPQLRGE